MTSFKDSIYSALNATVPLDLSGQLERHACVALILRGNSLEDLQLAFIQRAFSETDRWSGQMAFPGGKREDTDLTDLDAALRETLEEVGIDLSNSELVGRLNDIQARKAGGLLDFYIRPFVFYTERDFKIVLDSTEVADFFWFSLSEIQNPQRSTHYKLQRDNISLELPAVHLDREPPLWGLSYMMTQNLLEAVSSLVVKKKDS